MNSNTSNIQNMYPYNKEKEVNKNNMWQKWERVWIDAWNKEMKRRAALKTVMHFKVPMSRFGSRAVEG